MVRIKYLLPLILFFAVSFSLANCLFAAGSGVAFEGKPSFLPHELNSLSLIAELKKLEKALGLERTNNFIEFKEAESKKGAGRYSLIRFQKKTKMPFSYVDPDFTYRPVGYKTLRENVDFLSRAKIISDPSEYDFELYNCEALSGGAVITRELLRSKIERLVYVVIHEDVHDNLSLPSHMEEAAADLVSHVGRCKFLNLETDEILKEELREAEIVNLGYDLLRDLVSRYENKKITLEDFTTRKEAIIFAVNGLLKPFDRIRTSGWEKYNAVTISAHHTYSHYFPLMYRLFYALDSDVVRLVGIMREITTIDPSLQQPDNKCPEYFAKTRSAEKKIKIILEKIIRAKNSKQ